jgi:hypothetical protein
LQVPTALVAVLAAVGIVVSALGAGERQFAPALIAELGELGIIVPTFRASQLPLPYHHLHRGGAEAEDLNDLCDPVVAAHTGHILIDFGRLAGRSTRGNDLDKRHDYLPNNLFGKVEIDVLINRLLPLTICGLETCF